MPRAYVLSHGARKGNYLDTFVPDGKSISFYSEFDENTLRVNGLAAFNAGDIKPTETLTGPCPVANYVHSTFEDDAIAQHIASQSSASGGKPYYVGSDLPDGIVLCTTPKVCVNTYPQHADGCAGIFKRVAEDEIYSVACRGLSGAQNPATRELDGSTDLLDDNQAEAKRILDWAKTDQDAAMAYWQSLTQATRVSLASSYVPLRTYAEQYFQGGGEAIPEAVLEARRYLEAYGEETFYEWVRTLDPASRQHQLIMADPEFAEIVNRMNRQQLLGDGGGGQADPVAQLTARIDEESVAIATAVSQFQGSEQDDIASVSMTFEALMGDVQQYQASADEAHASSAASLYAAGAEVGVKLAMHQEQHEAESLAELTQAVDLMCQWSHSLAGV